MGNCTIANIRKGIDDTRRRVTFDLTLSAAYATGGDTLVQADLENLFGKEAEVGIVGAGGVTIDFFLAEIGSDGSEFQIDRTNKKVKAWNGRTEVPAATNLSGVTVRATAWIASAT